jgi:small subunit ribosomal protein S18
MARDRRSPKSAAADRRRPQKKKVSILNTESITWVDYKDVNLLRRFMSERAKIRARRVTGNSAQQQRAVARAIRVAREMALLPYSVRQVTQRKGGRRDRGERELREESLPRPYEAGEAPLPTPPGADEMSTIEPDAGVDTLDVASDAQEVQVPVAGAAASGDAASDAGDGS